ncbi:MAG: TetR/AcrR family transcriptional regulator [Actinomycetota bacterium]
MEAIDDPGPRRRGRPPSTRSEDTHRAIIDGARRLFGERHYDGVTNRDLAAAAGVTTCALYHDADSRLELDVQVDADLQARVNDRFLRAQSCERTFVGRFGAVLAEVDALNREDPTIARFVGAVRSDVRTHPEIASHLASTATERDQFFLRLVDLGISTGEISAGDRLLVIEFVKLVLVGLIEGSADGVEQHGRAVEALMALVRGELIRPGRPDPG